MKQMRDRRIKEKAGRMPRQNDCQKTIMVVSSHTPSLFWFRLNMMQDFANHGYHVIAVGQEPLDDWKKKFGMYGIKYVQLHVERNGMNPFKDIRTFRELDAMIKKYHPYKIFCYQAKTVIYTCFAARKNGIKEVYPLIAGLGSVFRGDSVKNRAVKQLLIMEYRLALKHCQSVMFQNEDDLCEFVRNRIINREKACIIHGSGVDLDKYTVMPMPNQVTFLMTARLIRDKGVMEYLEACRLIKQAYPDVRCMLVGPYDTNPSALKKEQIKPYVENGYIKYFGEQEDVRPFIKQSSVFVLPSYHEGTPKTVLESMACARAIITTDVPGCRETVTDGKNGFLVPAKNVKAIVEKMKLFIENPELLKVMGIEGRKIAEDKYDVRKVNESIIQIMNL